MVHIGHMRTWWEMHDDRCSYMTVHVTVNVAVHAPAQPAVTAPHRRNKKKAPSADMVFDFVAARAWRSNSKRSHVMSSNFEDQMPSNKAGKARFHPPVCMSTKEKNV